MKALLPIKRYLQENWLPISTITFITIFVWYKILNIVPSDYAYFGPLDVADEKYYSLKLITANASFFSQLIYFVLVPLFKDHITYYMLFQLMVMFLIYQVYYFMLIKITKDKGVSLIATIFFLANYVGSLTMFGTGNNQRFIQRIPNLPLIFISFYFLTKYLESNKTKHIIFSVVLYMVSVLLAHFSVLFLPILIIYPFIYLLINRHKYFLLKSTAISSLFLTTSILLTRGDVFTRPNYSPLLFIKETPDVIQMILYQISSISFPQQLTVFLSKLPFFQIPYPYLQTQNYVLIFVAFLSLIALIKVKTYSKILPLYITFFLSLFLLSFMIIYAYGADPNPIKFFDEDRIYFFHSIFIAFIWASWIKIFFGNNNKIFKIAGLLAVVIFLFHNTFYIWKTIDRYQYRSNMYKAFIDYIKNLSPSFNDKTVIVAPPDLVRTTDPFIRRFYNLDKAIFIALENGWGRLVTETKADKKNVFVLDYKYSYDSKNDIDPQSVKIVDKSADYRSNKKIEPFVKP